MHGLVNPSQHAADRPFEPCQCHGQLKACLCIVEEHLPLHTLGIQHFQ